MIKSLLIANRGEIACRIIRTARSMGIHTIAVYSQADESALHVRMADESHLLGPAPASDSYLRAGRILKIATEAGAEAIHPGYGFLSENADFAEMTGDAGMIFVGPPPAAIRAMGLKDKAKELMAEAGVPVVPGYHGTNQTAELLKRKAYEIGYPVLIKAVAGGGGKGMRLVEKAINFDEALTAAKREAKAAFGNDDVLIEKFISSPRHIEMQIFGDSKGNVVHLFERDCSLQRRHQKVIEEAPAPGMTSSVRKAMGKAATDAAKAVGYQGAGTIEFIVDGSEGLREDGFWFMEMNTRLQVEHPVTERVTGQDLVEWQLRVASGEKLPFLQEELTLDGHAVEARLYAEDPANGFLPSTGKLIALDWPCDDAVRVDSGVEAGDEISPHYDPMIAKMIVHAPTRLDAMKTLEQALKKSTLAGTAHNIGFLSNLVSDREFLAQNFDTGLIDRNLNALTEKPELPENYVAAGIASLMGLGSGGQEGPWSSQDAFQIHGTREIDYAFSMDGYEVNRRVKFDASGLSILDEDDQWQTPVFGAKTLRSGQKIFVFKDGVSSVFSPKIHAIDGDEGGSSSDGSVRVPMHGRIISITVKAGDRVEKGDILFSVEAMKMEHAVVAPLDGVVRELTIEVEDQTENGQQAMLIEPSVD